MMIPMKPSSMTMTMATIFRLREGIPPADFSLPESFSLSVVFRLVVAAEYLFVPPPGLRSSGRRSMRKGGVGGGPGPPHHTVARGKGGPRHPLVWALGGPPSAALLAHSVILYYKMFCISPGLR